MPPMTDMDAVGTANDLTMSSDLVATIPPPGDFGLPAPPQMTQPVTPQGPLDPSAAQFSHPSSPATRQHHFGLSGETGIEWLGSPVRQQQNPGVMGGPAVPVQPRPGQSTFEKAGVHFDLNM